MTTPLDLPPHPFPARMASEIALAALDDVPVGSVVLDPMCGAGTVLRAASATGRCGRGFDIDPLAVLLASVWTTPVRRDRVEQEASSVLEAAQSLSPSSTELPWVDDDTATSAFIDFWFAQKQRNQLRCLAKVLADRRKGSVTAVLRLAMSRLIITKERGASLARDVSHSRPHRVATDNDFDVFRQYPNAVQMVLRRIGKPGPVRAEASLGDARNLTTLQDRSIDLIVTSPPYLNAIDYMRGHRLALVWLGYQVPSLRYVRSSSVGAERAPDNGAELLPDIQERLQLTRLDPRHRRIVERYASDLGAITREMRRVLKPGSNAVVVIADSRLQGVRVRNADILELSAKRAGLELRERAERALPTDRRYLPLPDAQRAPLGQRMRHESVLRFVVVGSAS